MGPRVVVIIWFMTKASFSLQDGAFLLVSGSKQTRNCQYAARRSRAPVREVTRDERNKPEAYKCAKGAQARQMVVFGQPQCAISFMDGHESAKEEDQYVEKNVTDYDLDFMGMPGLPCRDMPGPGRRNGNIDKKIG